ncbi:hypothetical protein HMPREF9148_01184 [Prevotella sp. F0091]|nr:hypothetical protein HMPREF9148_01184 [Prevotella sp. F0091]
MLLACSEASSFSLICFDFSPTKKLGKQIHDRLIIKKLFQTLNNKYSQRRNILLL